MGKSNHHALHDCSSTGLMKRQISIIDDISVAIAVIRVLSFFMTLKAYLAGINPMVKLLAFKMIVGATFLISVRPRPKIDPTCNGFLSF